MKSGFKIGLCAGALAVGLLGGQASAVVHSIDFESDAPGAVPNGFVSADSPLVSFTDSMGPDLQISNFAPQSIGQGLGIFFDDFSQLIMNFAGPVNSLSLDFGNDDPTVAVQGDLAVLTVFDGLNQVGQTTVGLNLNDLMDQTIMLSGVQFDNATFAYADAGLNNIGLIEIVDNIVFNTVDGVPEPVTAALGLIGLGALSATIRRRRTA